MIIFTRGLVLRKGERSFEFERDLGDGNLQFKRLDTFEVITFSVTKLYADILEGIIQVVRPVPKSQAHLPEPQSHQIVVLPAKITKPQEALIAFRMHFIRAAIRMRATFGSFDRCAEVLAQTSRPQGIDDKEREMINAIDMPKAPTLMRWLKIYQESGANPYALCDRRSLAIKPKRINCTVEGVIEDAIVKYYMQLRGATIKQTCSRIRDLMKLTNRRDGTDIKPPSEKTVARRINDISEFVRDTKRFGAAYARNKWRYSLAGDQSTRILERVEVDHTMLDVWVLDPRSGVPLGRPWITALIDRMSGYILGVYISFYGPSAASVANAMRVSILPKDEILADIPEIQVRWTAMGVAELYVVDNGLEFHSRTFRRIAWELSADLLYNPVHQPWLKPGIERSMMEFNRMLPMEGKVFAAIKNMQNVDPKKTSAILFDDLCSAVIHWAAAVHPFHIHKKTLVRPIDLWSEGLEYAPPPMFPTSMKNLELATGISAQRTVTGDGIFFQYMRYNSAELQDYCRRDARNFRTEIRFNPDDLGEMHVHLPKANEWLKVPLQRPNYDYGNGLSLIQHQIIRQEAGKRLSKANAEEELCRAQTSICERWKEAISRGVKVRKHADLIRFQGHTSAKITPKNTSMQGAFTSTNPPEASPKAAEVLDSVMPFRAFSLDEDME